MTARTLQRRHLEALVSVADRQSVHGAARTLGMAQPALSRLLSEAEVLLGARVFERSSQGSRATAQGEVLLTQARLVLRGLERLGGALRLDPAPVRLGCIARAVHTLMPALLELTHPPHGAEAAVRLRLIEGSSTSLLDAVTRGTLDFAILRTTAGATLGEAVRIEPLYSERTVVICSGSHPVAHRQRVSLARLAEETWVLPEPETSSRAAFDRFWGDRGLPSVRPVVETRSFEANLALVEHTRFLSVAPESIAQRHAAFGAVRIVRTREALAASPVSLAFHRQAQEDPALDRMRTLIHAAASRTRAQLRRKPGRPA